MDRKIEAVIFDWAGTTVDYGCFAPVQAFSEVFKEFGVTPTMEEVRKPMGMLKIDHIRTMLSMDRIQQCWQEKYNRPSNEEDVQKMYAVYEAKLLSVLDQYARTRSGQRAKIKRNQDWLYYRIYRQDDDDRYKMCRRKWIQTRCVVQSRFCRIKRKTISIHGI